MIFCLFRAKITKMRVSKFWIPEFRSFRAAGQHSLLASKFSGALAPEKIAKNIKKIDFSTILHFFGSLARAAGIAESQKAFSSIQ